MENLSKRMFIFVAFCSLAYTLTETQEVVVVVVVAIVEVVAVIVVVVVETTAQGGVVLVEIATASVKHNIFKTIFSVQCSF
ncbi:hypothetical protein ElyMa_003343200 [Elysia marginata]|uniref:Secreted protein n=1 Tax=Elysia marginata TaxID=1093978 RepID=A0AAV4JFY6_9GAST|nr:hypothetical protein ElyMa_003343200 [Elysia marginata]